MYIYTHLYLLQLSLEPGVLSELTSLARLELSHSRLEQLTGLCNLTALTHLNVSTNRYLDYL